MRGLVHRPGNLPGALHSDRSGSVSSPVGRTVLVREGVGATARILQRCELLLPDIVIDRPTIIAVRRGTKTLRWKDGGVVLGPGEAVAVAGGQVLDITNRPCADGWYEAVWLVWDGSVIADHNATDQTASTIQHVLPLGRLSATFREVLDRALDAIRDRENLPHAVARHRLSEVLLWISFHGGRFEIPRATSVTSRVRGLISSAPARPWNAPFVARHLAMSEGTLRRRLATEGLSFSKLLVDVRMLRALTLLQATDRPITQIAGDVGYNSPSRFAVRFRERFGHPPTAIRGHAAAR